MVDLGYVQVMARYNAWQNESLALASDGVGDAARRQDRGGYFGSIFGTLNHLLWGDRIWMHRFAGTPAPRSPSVTDSVGETENWAAYRAERTAMNDAITGWAKGLDPGWLEGDMGWFSSAVQRDLSKPKAMLVMHFFNHATHHRGQIHAMLTAAGAKPDDTDLSLLPD